MSWNELDELPPIFFPSEANIDKELFAPLARNSTSLDCMVGYFTSGVLGELANAIASYLKIASNEPMRFIVSPNLSSSDLLAIQSAYESGEEYFSILFPDIYLTESEIKKHTVAALAHLVVEKKLELRVALKKSGLFHAKVWLFETENGLASVHGSSNATVGGMLNNFEQLVVDLSWLNFRSHSVNVIFKEKFNKIWNSEEEGIVTIGLNQETLSHIQDVNRVNPGAADKFEALFEKLYQSTHDLSGNYSTSNDRKLKIPNYINYQEGEFAHQGDAVTAWEENNRKGILAIATGGGKTYTSLIAATLLAEEVGSLFVVVAVPTKNLMIQWEDDVSEFDLVPINTNNYSPSAINKTIKTSLRNLRLKNSAVEIIILTHNALVSGNLDFKVGATPALLIVDEVHNIGSEKSQENFPKGFDYLLALSATYERQYDEEGTNFLLETFDKVVYEYGLDKAIGSCLVNYKYHAHFVSLTAEEADDFIDLTYQIKRLSYAADSSDGSPAKDKWQLLCLKRRKLIESSDNKIKKLREVLPLISKEIKRTLIFCTDKAPEQLNEVNKLLNERSVNFHQVTSEETSNSKALKSIIESFSEDKLQVLTSKRVLDEGFNVPQTETAYLLSSNTVARQWMQRLGRVLRLSGKTKKKYATIHDFVVVPVFDGKADEDLKSLLESEYKRVEFFSKYSDNYMDENGGYQATQKLIDLIGG